MYDQIVSSRAAIQKAHGVVRAIHNPFRLKVLQAVHNAGKISVTDLYVKLKCTQSEASQALATLRKVGIVKNEASGKNRFYYLDQQVIGHVLETLAKL